jgi:hypothetical protein
MNQNKENTVSKRVVYEPILIVPLTGVYENDFSLIFRRDAINILHWLLIGLRRSK